ncbi:MAG TPA: type II secretion system major pseudopilin GspG [Tepidisphaeraceae bacterium]|jgi:general secretion pathway protein G
MPHSSRNRRRSGFTLIELLLVLVILAVLAGIVIPKFTGRAEDARKQAAKTQIDGFKTALDAFEVDIGRYPTEADGGLDALVVAPAGAQNWHQTMSQIPKDPWGNPYQYRQPGTKNPGGYDVYSYGADGRDGGTDDIGNWEAGK